MKFISRTHSLTAALDQLRVVASTSNDPGPRSGQLQQIGQCLLPLVAANFFVDDHVSEPYNTTDCTREVYILRLVEKLSICRRQTLLSWAIMEPAMLRRLCIAIGVYIRTQVCKPGYCLYCLIVNMDCSYHMFKMFTTSLGACVQTFAKVVNSFVDRCK